MSNKPDIYGTCKAGCQWKTVHYDDFARSASIIRQQIPEDGVFYFEKGKEYKIFANNDGTGAFGCTIKIANGFGNEIETIDCAVNDEFADSFIFKWLDSRYEQEEGGTVTYYELAGVRYKSESGMYNGATYVSITGATDIFLYNANATIKGEDGDDGDSVFVRYSANADGTDFTEEWSEGQTYIGFATAQTAPTDKSAYEWVLMPKGKDGESVEISQTIGTSKKKVMSQKAVTDCFAERDAFIGFPQNLLDINSFTTTHTGNWTITTSENVLTVTHNTSYTTGSPLAPLSLGIGKYVFNAIVDGATNPFYLYKADGTQVQRLVPQSTFTVEEDAQYEIRVVWSGTGSFTATDVSIYQTGVKSIVEDVDNLKASIGALTTEKNYESTNNVAISASNGNLLNAGNTIYCVAKVNVEPLKSYTISGSAKYGFACWAFYDEEGALIEASETATAAVSTFENVEVTAPENASYIHVSYITESVIAKIQTSEVNNYKRKWSDKKWVCVGDSLTDANNTTSTKRYFDYVYYDTGINIVNMGVSGSGYARRADDSNAFYQRVENIDTTADVVTIFGSFNDLGAGLEMGTATDTDTTTIGGCINATIDVIQSKIPTVVLGIVSPTPWESTKPSTSGHAYNYVNLLKEICELRSIPFLDLWRCSNLRPWDEDFRTLAYSKDNGAGTHPDETGHKIIAPKFKCFLESLII